MKTLAGAVSSDDKKEPIRLMLKLAATYVIKIVENNMFLNWIEHKIIHKISENFRCRPNVVQVKVSIKRVTSSPLNRCGIC